MKKVTAFACLLVLLAIANATIVSAQPQQSAWRFYMKADDGYGANAMSSITIGTYSTSKDGYGIDGPSSDIQDGPTVIPTTYNTRGIVGVFGGKAWVKDVKSTRIPLDHAYDAGQTVSGSVKFGDPDWGANLKIWDLRVFCLRNSLGNAPSGCIRLQFLTISSTTRPVSTLPDPTYANYPSDARYCLRMVDNRGVAGAPANGDEWSIPIPTVHSATPYFTLTLPMQALSARDESAALSEGYVMQFIQYQEQRMIPTPEPSSLMALAGGLMGLAGFAVRRRHSR